MAKVTNIQAKRKAGLKTQPSGGYTAGKSFKMNDRDHIAIDVVLPRLVGPQHAEIRRKGEFVKLTEQAYRIADAVIAQSKV